MIPESDLQRAREVDLLSYLRVSDPGQLVRFSKNTYCTREHDSLKISNGKWHWFSRGIGGTSALDYLMKVKGYSLPDAVSIVLGNNMYEKACKAAGKEYLTKELKLPERYGNNDCVIRYLIQRGIECGAVGHCISEGLLYESRNHHSAVFVGKDENGKPRYAAMRSITGDYKGEAYGSNKEYAFNLGNIDEAKNLHVFESPIDLLSYITILEMYGKEWKNKAFISLGGVNGSGTYKQLNRILNLGQNIQTIRLHLDNDEPGRNATAQIKRQLSWKYKVVDCPPKRGKDVNECLQLIIRDRQKKKDERNER